MEVILDGLQGGERVLVHDEFTEGPFLGFPSEMGKEEVDLRLRRLEKSRGDGDIDFSKPAT